jgi:hypothetical protein
MVVSSINYYKNISTPRHPTWFPYYRSTAFPTQIFRDLLLICLRQHKAALLTLLQLPPDAPPQPVVGAHAAYIPLRSPARLLDTCYACGTTQRWQSIYDVVVCAKCHPPADVALVAAWEGEAYSHACRRVMM